MAIETVNCRHVTHNMLKAYCTKAFNSERWQVFDISAREVFIGLSSVPPNCSKTSCRWQAATCPAPLLPLWAPKRPPSQPRLQSADRNIAAGSHGQYVPTLTAAAAWRVNAAVSKAAWWPWPLTLKVLSESRVTWATCMPILLLLDLAALDLGPMYATDRCPTDSIIA